jgi:hypothetical protein
MKLKIMRISNSINKTQHYISEQVDWIGDDTPVEKMPVESFGF